jgi:acetyl/propionyl-CoA carboxylase alpha subunit
MTSLLVTLDGAPFEIDLNLSESSGDVQPVTVNGETLSVVIPRPQALVRDMEWLIINGWPYEIAFDPDLQWIKAYDGLHKVEIHDRNQHVARPRSGDGRVKAPIPGLITRILVEPGAQVEAGQALLILEAMKMENEIRAPFDGFVSSIPVSAGQTVARNQVLVEVK